MEVPMRLGRLTPSSNTVLEPFTAEMLRDAPGITAHFSRFRVLSIGLDAGQSAQFDPAAVVAVAELLADASRLGARRVAPVAPSFARVQGAILATLAREGLD